MFSSSLLAGQMTFTTDLIQHQAKERKVTSVDGNKGALVVGAGNYLHHRALLSLTMRDGG